MSLPYFIPPLICHCDRSEESLSYFYIGYSTLDIFLPSVLCLLSSVFYGCFPPCGLISSRLYVVFLNSASFFAYSAIWSCVLVSFSDCITFGCSFSILFKCRSHNT